MVKKPTSSLLILLLMATCILAGRISSSGLSEEALQKALARSEAQVTKVASKPSIYRVSSSNPSEKDEGYCVIDSGSGYGGPMWVATLTDRKGKIKKVSILSHKDTPSFIDLITAKHLTAEFAGVAVEDPDTLEGNVDAISGATYSSKGVISAVASGSRALALHLGKPVPSRPASPFRIEAKEIWIALLLLVTVAASQFKLTKLRWPLLLAGLFILGLSYNSPLSIAQIARVLLGYFPPVKESIGWYLMVMGLPLAIFLCGKNIYCLWICPFGAIQELTTVISGKRLSCQKCVKKKAQRIKTGLLTLALFLAVIYKNPAQASFEPFATLFALNGSTYQWVLLPLVIFSSFFFSRIWCRYFCPVSPVLHAIAAWGRRTKSLCTLHIRKNNER